jgi:integrase
MKYPKRSKLPRGLRWDPRSPYICFSWRDGRKRLHQQSTGTADPAEAMAFKLRFLRDHKEGIEQRRLQSEDRSRLPLTKVAELYFGWKAANSASGTISRERRMFRNIERAMGKTTPVRAVDLELIREYQQERRKQISPTMKKAVTARTVNYELQLLRGVMRYAGCWNGEIAECYRALNERKSRVGRAATKEQLMKIIAKARENEYWKLAMYCAAVAAGSGCRSWEIKHLRLSDIRLADGNVRGRDEIAKNRQEREPRLMALAEWGLRELLYRARELGASEPEHYLLPLNLRKSRHWSKKTKQKWDPTQPMVSWVKSWRKLMAACQMKGFRFHDLRHTFRTHGAEAGVPLEVMMAQLGHMDRETSLDYVHIQQRALQRAKELIEREQAEVLAVARGRVENSVRRIVTPPVLPSAGLRSSIHSIARSRRLSITRRGAYKRRR